MPAHRPALATVASAPHIFCRPMDPSPAPLVYINGWHGVGKETVAEYLTLLLGKDKSLLVDVRSIGGDGDSDIESGDRPGTRKAKHSYKRRPRPLLTPEHPRYFSFDLFLDTDTALDVNHPLNSDSNPISPSLPSSVSSFSSPSYAFSSSASSRSASISSNTTVSTTTSAIATADFCPPYLSPNIPFPAAAPTPTPTSTSTTALTQLLTLPENAARTAVLAACCPDTPTGRATLRTFETAAERAGRLFVFVVLSGERHEHGVNSIQRRQTVVTGSIGHTVDQALAAYGNRYGCRYGCGFGARRGSEPVVRLPEASMPGTSSAGPMEQEVMPTSPSLPSGLPAAEGVAAVGGSGWVLGRREGGIGLAAPARAAGSLTVDVTSVSVFEAALQIVGFVKGLEAERDAELCSTAGGSTATTPHVDVEDGKTLDVDARGG
ncbi:hypothetical protein N656DRAFT_775011 [Canariomyces notabilis]|uniref:Uncharacterized protein n=1 Tax=Canariomyces notabilis TaxID=2074819 RepID=A0AAN6YXR9_9PEZI|nr:hypothetical protein N656DRAFT_775011 [Canariomyces arenarius]